MMGVLHLSIFVENIRMLDLESPIISETKELLELSSVGNLSATADANWLKNLVSESKLGNCLLFIIIDL